MIPTTLVAGGSAAARERTAAALLAPGESAALILEGLPDGKPFLVANPQLRIERIAPGCLCCSGQLVLRVTLNRVLRAQPQRLVIGLANAEHLDQLRSWLSSTPYDQLLELGPSLRA